MFFESVAAASTRTEPIDPDREPLALTGLDPRPRGLLVVDLDGTIVDGHGVLDHLAAEALEIVAAGGVRVVLATGRSPWSGIAEIGAVIGLRGPQITMQGALVVDPLDASLHLARPIAAGLYFDALLAADELGLDPIVGLVDGFRAERLPEWLAGTTLGRAEADHFQYCEDLSDLGEHDPYRVWLPTTPARHEAVRRFLMARFGSQASIVWTDATGVEILAPGVDKGSAMAWLAEVIGVPMHRTAAIGDARNDIAMLLRAGRSAAMGSAPEEVRRAADIVVPPVEEHGAVEALRWFYPDLLADVSRVIEPRGADWPLAVGPEFGPIPDLGTTPAIA